MPVRKWTGRYWSNPKTSAKISRGLKKWFSTHPAHNKGKVTSKIVKIWGTHNKWRRATKPNYYLRELRENAMRNEKLKYDKKRMAEIYKLHYARIKRCGRKFQPKRWTSQEIDYLATNYKEMFIEDMAKQLKRSYASLCHKLSRLNLEYNHHWR